ncbi:hypothetical protein M9H77_17787 [Catharanthus roseus]|uniref:Uncharacterized protein n=1 Tax=Catharanthus roseus TaxID=4058 RepID=A0ACC0B5L0_CATRO|nr:hypothetical protein M9H77_17787 [Catharanthus roseus]
MEIDVIEKSEGINLLTHEINFVLVDDSLCLQESCKKLEENDEERKTLMEFKGNCKNTKREQSLCYGKARISRRLELGSKIAENEAKHRFDGNLLWMEGCPAVTDMLKTRWDVLLQQPTMDSRSCLTISGRLQASFGTNNLKPITDGRSRPTVSDRVQQILQKSPRKFSGKNSIELQRHSKRDIEKRKFSRKIVVFSKNYRLTLNFVSFFAYALV